MKIPGLRFRPMIQYSLLVLGLILSVGSVQRSHAQCCNFTDSGQAIDTLPTFGVALGDIDNDGDQDALTIEAYSRINVFKNNGSGIFSNTQVIIPTGGEENNFGVYLVNVDTDNDLDAIVIPFYNDGSLKIYTNNGNGMFSLSQAVSANLGGHYAGIADIDNDGDTDVMLAGWMSPATKVFKNNGSGSFSLFSSLSLVNFGGCNDITMADFDGDTDIDAVVVSASQGGRLLLNNGTGTFTDSGITIGNTSDNYTCCASADIDKNGTADLVTGTMYSTLNIFKNNGTGTFSPFFSAPSSNYDKQIHLIDQDYDGAPDVFVSNYGSNGLEVWSNDGEGNLSLCYTNATPMPQTYSHGFDVGLLNGDSYYDAFMGYFGGDGDKIFFGDPLFYAATVMATVCQGEAYMFPDSTTSTQNGTHVSQFVAANGCDSNIVTHLSVTPVNIQVHYLPGSNFIVALAVNAGFQWLDCNNGYAPIPNEVSPLFSPQQTGYYAVAVTQNGCTDTSACVPFALTGIPENQDMTVDVLFNPGDDYLYLKTRHSMGNTTILLADATGRICLNRTVNLESEIKIDLSFLAKGFFTLILQHPEKKGYTVKIIR